MKNPASLLLPAAACTLIGCAARADTYTIRLDAAAVDQPCSGRIVLCFITETGMTPTFTPWRDRSPLGAPFYDDPQPMAGVTVTNLRPGGTVTIDDSTPSIFGGPLDAFDGPIRVQAVLDRNDRERSFTSAPGNIRSAVYEFTPSAARNEQFEIVLNDVVSESPLPADTETLKWVELRSDLLSEFYGYDVFHRAGVALPPSYLKPEYAERQFGATYVIPGFGGRHTMARDYDNMYSSMNIEEVAPVAVHIVLDPDSPLGHHGFMDSPNHGPRSTALVTEFIPWLEKQFRIRPSVEARIVTGHSSGGWSSLWLQLQWPEVFGACWSSAPDPVDFRAFQMTNLYEDESLFVMPDGAETPSFRAYGPPRGQMRALMSVREEAAMERIISPDGRSGEQWDAWEAMFSPRDETTGLPKPMFDVATGAIDREVVEHWSKYDIGRLVREDWERFGPTLIEKVRLACGSEDSYYLNRAVELLKAIVDEHAPDHGGPGSIRIAPGRDHSTIMNEVFIVWNEQMRAHLRAHGLMD